jgi:hypothetical protein
MESWEQGERPSQCTLVIVRYGSHRCRQGARTPSKCRDSRLGDWKYLEGLPCNNPFNGVLRVCNSTMSWGFPKCLGKGMISLLVCKPDRKRISLVLISGAPLSKVCVGDLAYRFTKTSSRCGAYEA